MWQDLEPVDRRAIISLMRLNNVTDERLWAQLPGLTCVLREFDPGGYYVDFEDQGIRSEETVNLVLRGTGGSLHGQTMAGFYLFIRDGWIKFLEGAIFDLEWPNDERLLKVSPDFGDVILWEPAAGKRAD